MLSLLCKLGHNPRLMDSTPSNVELSIGSHFGPYQVTRLLGEGAFGAVYEAIKQPLGKRVALKILHSRWAESAQVTERFIQEARAAASLRHPHIVDVDDIGSRDGVPWIAMEFLEGESLASRLEREHRLSLEIALELMLPIFSAVAAVHDKGIIHRDLKPENIQLWQGTADTVHPKLLDFGIAKVAENHSGQSLTGATEIMGTPEYMAPEQWKSAKFVSPASDQWALAVILYRLITGISPFRGDSAQSIMFHVSIEATPPFPPELREYTAIEAVLAKALQKDALNRFASVRSLAAELLPFASSGVRQRWRTEFAQTPSNSITPAKVTDPSLVNTRTVASQSNGSLISTSQLITQPKAKPTGLIAAISAVALLGAVGILAKFATRTPPTAPTTSLVRHSATTAPAEHTLHALSQPELRVPTVAVLAQDSGTPAMAALTPTVTADRRGNRNTNTRVRPANTTGAATATPASQATQQNPSTRPTTNTTSTTGTTGTTGAATTGATQTPTVRPMLSTPNI